MGIQASGSDKSGSMASLGCTSGWLNRPSRPPTSGKPRIQEAAHTDPTIARMNCTKSVRITARNPPSTL